MWIKRSGTVLAMGVPFFLSLLAVCVNSWKLAALSVLSIFVLTGILPCCRRHENLWLFVVSAYTLLPLNLCGIVKLVMPKLSFSSGEFLYASLTCIEYLLVLISVEEVLIGLAGRFLWRKQCQLRL